MVHGCLGSDSSLKKLRRMCTISQAKNKANHVRQVNVVVRALKTSWQSSEYFWLQPWPRLPSPNTNTTSANEERQRAAIQNP